MYFKSEKMWHFTQAVLSNEKYRNNEGALACNVSMVSRLNILTLKSQLGKLIVKICMLRKHLLILLRTS